MKVCVLFPITECLYVLEEGGSISAFDTIKNPCARTGQWTAPNEIGSPPYIHRVVYPLSQPYMYYIASV